MLALLVVAGLMAAPAEAAKGKKKKKSDDTTTSAPATPATPDAEAAKEEPKEDPKEEPKAAGKDGSGDPDGSPALPPVKEDKKVTISPVELNPQPVTPKPKEKVAELTTTIAADATPAHEGVCNDHVDEDLDSMVDCADNDCKNSADCRPDGKPENTPERCSDHIDNDNDGFMDCDEQECQLGRMKVCNGSWKGDLEGNGLGKGGNGGNGGGNAVLNPDGPTDPEEGGDGKAVNPDVESADSADGVGFVGIRFGVVASVFQSIAVNDSNYEAPVLDTTIPLLQLRAFGSLPLLEDSFFLINIRGERSPRLTFAMFQFPIGGGHSINFNSGGGTLSNQLIISTAKQPLLEPAFYMTSAFEQGNGASVEVNGPIVTGLLRYRAYLAGGAGFGTGNVGGRRFTFDQTNYTYSAGAQLQYTPIGHWSRFDTPYMYTPAPATVALSLGGKYEQRVQERFPAVNTSLIARYGHFEIFAENYTKYELNFESWQTAYTVMAGVLLWPETFFFAADFGGFYASDFGKPPEVLGTELRRLINEQQFRTALHWYFWRNNGVMSLRYTNRMRDPPKVGPDSDRTDQIIDQELGLNVQFRF